MTGILVGFIIHHDCINHESMNLTSHHHSQGLRIFYVFYFEFYSFVFYIWVYDHFELICVKTVKPSFIFWNVDVQRNVLKRVFFSTLLPLLLCQNSVSYLYVGLFLDSLLYTLTYLPILLPVPYCLGYCRVF